MEQMAMPGSILITPGVCKLAEGYIQVKSLGPVPIKGLNAPVEVSEVVGAEHVRTRLQATAARGLTPFVGRDAELHSLHQALQQSGASHGQVVAAIGEAGVGKSRLVYEFLHLSHTQNWLVLESASVSYGKATSYFPVIELLKRYVRVEDADDARAIRAKVTGQVPTLDDTLQDTIPALLALLDALPEDSPFQQLDPPQRRQRTLTALKRVLLRESRVQPLLLVFEYLHWIDAETLDDPGRLGWVSVAMSHSFSLLGDQAGAIAASQRPLVLAEALSEGGLQIMATFNLGRAYFDLGDYRRAMECLRQSAAALKSDLLRERFGQDYLPAVFSRVGVVPGRGQSVRRRHGDGRRRGPHCRDGGSPFIRIGAHYGVGAVSLRKGDLHQAIPRLEHALGLIQVVQAPSWFLVIASALCPAYAHAGCMVEVRGLLEQAVARGAMRLTSHESRRVAAFSEVYLLAGHLEEASAHARKTLALARTRKERGSEAWTLRLLGAIAAHHEPPEVASAKDYYRQALTLADELGMRPLVAHCHLGLGTLHAKIGRPEQAQAELSTAIELYRTMDMTFWLPQAEAELAQMEGR
jgi:tetratricopeptide (TPR) repeat protein